MAIRGERGKGYRQTQYPTRRPGGRGKGEGVEAPHQIVPAQEGDALTEEDKAAVAAAWAGSVDSPEEIAEKTEQAAKILFKLFKEKIRPSKSETHVMESLKIMLPGHAEGHILSLIMQHCGNVPGVFVYTETDTQQLMDIDDIDDKNVASDIKYVIGRLFNYGEGNLNLLNMGKFYGMNSVWIKRLEVIERQYSEAQAAAVAANAVIKMNSEEEEVLGEGGAPAPGWVDLELGPEGNRTRIPGVQVDRETLHFILDSTKNFVGENFVSIAENISSNAKGATIISIKIGLATFKMSMYTILWMSKYLYDYLILKAGGMGPIIKYITGILDKYKKELFAGPFMNFNDPEMQESKIRRTNRLVYIFLYAMIDLLNHIKDKRRTLSGILKAVYGDPLRPGLNEFLDKEISEWSFKEILEFGPMLFDYIMKNKQGQLFEYYDTYNISIKVVTDLLNDRIAKAQVNQKRTPTINTSKTIIEKTPPIRKATGAEMDDMQSAVNSIFLLGGIERVRETICSKGYADMIPRLDGEGEARMKRTKKKRTRRRRKSKGNNSTKGKKKKGKKRKQTKRGRKKK